MIAIWTYRLTIAPLMTVGLVLVSPFQKKLRAILGDKLKPWPKLNLPSPPIWIHAASGEFEYAKPVIRELKKRNPDTPVVVTYSSISFKKQIEGFPGVDVSLPLPLDLPGPVLQFIKRLRPKHGLIARTDLWPELLFQFNQQKIPLTVFSYTQKDPGSMSWPSRQIRRWLLTQVQQLACVSLADRENLRRMGILNAEVAGDTRYDQVAYRLAHGQNLPVALKPRTTTLVAGSTWPEDEAVLIPGLREKLKSQKLKLIIAPHEPTKSHLDALKKQIRDENLTFAMYSDEQNWDDKHVLLVDKVGVLAELYSWGQIGFVGGSFRGSVHSVMESLGAGLPTLVGPDHQNNREALEFSKDGGPVLVCTNEKAISETVDELLEGGRLKKEAILSVFKARQGASIKIVNLIEDPASFRLSDDPGLSPHN